MQTNYENLVFEGGGVCSFAYCGAISELEKMGILSKIKRFAGSSMRKQINAILSTRISRDETLSGLFEKTGKELVLVSCCINTEKAVYFHHATHGNVKVIDAIIASMSIPVFFRPLQLEECFFVDGAIVDNYPIWIFNDIDALYKNKITNFDRENVNPLTLGLKLNNHGQKSNGSNSKTPVTNIIDLLYLMGNILAGVVDSNNYSNKYNEQTIKISNGDVYFLDLFITKDQISQLVKNGIDGVKNYFNNSSYFNR